MSQHNWKISHRTRRRGTDTSLPQTSSSTSAVARSRIQSSPSEPQSSFFTQFGDLKPSGSKSGTIGVDLLGESYALERQNSDDSHDYAFLSSGVGNSSNGLGRRVNLNGVNDDSGGRMNFDSDVSLPFVVKRISGISSVQNNIIARKKHHNIWSLIKLAWLVGLLVAISLALYSASNENKKGTKPLKKLRIKKKSQLEILTNGMVSDGAHIGIEIPPAYSNLSEVYSTYKHHAEIPFFWSIPRAGGTSIRDILQGCMHLRVAGSGGPVKGQLTKELIEVVELRKGISQLNVDMTTVDGIERAGKLNLASSGIVDAMFSSHLHDVSNNVFTSNNQGMLFALFRHPIHRVVSWFYFVQDTNWRRKKSDLSDITIEEYFKSGSGENNWMTRFLSHQMTKKLTSDDLNVAKEVLRRKCIVGLLDEMGESMSRFEKVFGWRLNTEEDEECEEKKLQWGWAGKHRHASIDEGSIVWNLIVRKNEFDMKLYEYAKILFVEQGIYFHEKVT